jgi:hypothetical protein
MQRLQLIKAPEVDDMHPALLAAAVTLMPVASETTAPAPGTIAIVARDAETTVDPTVATFLAVIRRAILQTAFLPLPDGGHGRYVAKVAVSQTSPGVVSSAGSGSAAASNVTHRGNGLSWRLPSRKRQLHDLIVTRLDVIVVRRSDDHVVWTGQATTARIEGTPAGMPAVVAAALSEALFRQFPCPLPGPVSVP